MLRRCCRMLEDPMDLKHVSVSKHMVVAGMVILIAMIATEGTAFGQVRGKKPDRGTYQSPRLEPVEVESVGRSGQRAEVSLPEAIIVKPKALIAGAATTDDSNVRQAAAWTDETVIWDEAPILHDDTCDGCSECDSYGCDSYGCDSIGPHHGHWTHRWANAFLPLDRSRWFGNIELLLMFPKGDRLPPLVTTSTSNDPDLAGQLDQADTEILYGNERVLNELRAGGRLTLGAWIDPSCCRSLVLRGWYGGNDTDSFATNDSKHPVITRPFFNVSDGQVPEQDTQIIAFPNRATGSISVEASSEVFGADISARQKWFSRFGGTVDLLYGYQFMRMSEDLSISSTSISQNEDFAPLGSLLAIDDRFGAENEFHGGQFGLASRYREGCWSFHGLAKVGFGSLRRGVALSGETLTSNGGINATDPNGLLVRSTNVRVENDYTFGWVPELDFSLGWQQYPRFDVTVGYNIIAMTDAIQVSGLIDPDLAVNLSDPPLGAQRPSRRANYRTYYAQGIHFGLRYVY